MDKNIAKSILKNTAVLMSSQVVTWSMSFILLLFLPRYLGSVDYGRLYLAGSITVIFSLLIDFGGRFSISKEVAQNREAVGEIAVNAIGIRIILWIFAFIALIIFTQLSPYNHQEKLLIIIYGVGLLWESVRKVFWSCFQGFEKMRYPSLGAIVDQIFITTTAVIALLLGAGFFTIGIIYMIGSFLNFIIHFKFSSKIIPTFPKFQLSESIKLIKKGIPFFLWSIFGIIYYRIDAIMLSYMTTESVVGWYGAAYRFFDILMFIPSIFSIAIFPIFSRLYKDKENLYTTTNKSVDYIILAGIPVSICIMIFTPEIINFFFGLKQYSNSIGILKIFSAGLILVYIDMILGTAILASDKLKQWTIVAFIAVFVNIGFNLLLIPYTQQQYNNGGIGAAIATVFTEFFVMMCAIKIIPKEIFQNAKSAVIPKALLSGLITYVFLYYLHQLPIFWILEAIISVFLYIALSFVLKVFEPQEVTFFKENVNLKNIKNLILPTKDI